VTVDALLDRWEALKAEAGATAPADPPIPTRPSMFKPLSDAADEFVRWAQSPEKRVMLGIPDLDAEMRGIAPGELALIIGYSHSGKTLTLLEILKNNRDKHVIYFCPDEPRPLTLVKLTCVLHGMRARELEMRIQAEDRDAVDLLRRTASESYPHLAVFDQSVGLADMERSLGEVMDEWGHSPDLVVFDYLELLGGGTGDVPSQAAAIKSWGRRHDVPLLVLHQTSRSSGAEGKRLTMSSGAYGGEQQATHIVGVRRKVFELEAEINELADKLERAGSASSERMMEQLEFLRYEARIHQHTLTVSLLKNKRPDASRLPEIDYEIEKGTGRITRLQDGCLPLQYLQEVRNAIGS
jgi:replicative DNA helicase